MTVKAATVQNWIKDLDPNGLWIKYETDYSGNVKCVMCKLCQKHKEQIKMKRNFSAAFVLGITGSALKKDNVMKHCRSDMHRAAVYFEIRPTQSLSDIFKQTTLGQALVRASTEERERVGKLIEIAYFVAKEELPFSMLPALVALEKKHGVNLGDTYLSERKCRDFIDCIGEGMRESVTHELKNARYLSIMVDGATDAGAALVYAKYVSVTGKVETRFLGLKDLPSLDAGVLEEAVRECLMEFGLLELSNGLVGLVADGAGSNLDGQKGLAQLLRKECEWLVAVHCLTHRLELAVKDSIRGTYFDHVEQLLTDLYSYCKDNPEPLRELATLVEIMEEESGPGISWVDHKKRAVEFLVKSYQPIIAHLEKMAEDPANESEGEKLSGYLQKLKERQFVAHLLFFMEIFKPLARFSLALQEESCDFLYALSCLERFYDSAHELVSNRSSCDDLAALLGGSELFHGVKLTGPSVEIATFSSYLNDLKQCICERFGDMHREGVFHTLKILDMSLWPKEKEALKSYADSELERFLHHFGELLKLKKIEPEAVWEEWKEFKNFWYIALSELPRQVVWSHLLTVGRRRFFNLSHVFEILLLFPVPGGISEQCFATVSRMSCDWRCQLRGNTVEHLIRICGEGPPMEHFSPLAATDRFFESVRCSDTQPYLKRKNLEPEGLLMPAESPEDTEDTNLIEL
ncbi:zinc finger protein 862-like [Latimeria chalumnae]|uniref:zinc finger protein 862-like n=1 Tax=Latimeria chalumnae TaxID=7897 RepID=UPI0006D9181E|nr:PREDICTED: zinc finger protein 862-like [Latimeria chalumnae]|eukprot:XP_014344302.1 PREDICTED: zinc finger protein 862-like [Latimeria chalumnae]